MDETRTQEDAALSLSDGGPLRQVRDPGGLESEGLALGSGNTLRGRLLQTSQMSETQASLESTVTAAQDQSGLSHIESPPVLSPIVTTAEQRRAVLSLASLPGDEAQPKVPASVSSVAIASLAMSSVAGSVISSHAPVGVVSSFTPVGGVLSSMLSVRESRSTAELERMHTSPRALPFTAELVECAYAGATRSRDDD